MKALVRSEFLKLRTTRTLYYLLAGIVVISVVTVLDPNHTATTFRKPFNEQTFVLFTSMLTRLLIFVLGIRLITDEFRHGTVVSTFLTSPRRGRVLGAKAIVAGGAGVIAAATAWFVMTGAASIVASMEGASLVLDPAAWMTLGAMTAAGGVWAILGVLVGAIVRNQLVATVGGLLWLMGIEDMFRGLLGDLGYYLPGQAGLGMILAPDGGKMLTSAAFIVGYIAIFGVIGSKVLKRDIA